jgi:hypothetical protein
MIEGKIDPSFYSVEWVIYEDEKPNPHIIDEWKKSINQSPHEFSNVLGHQPQKESIQHGHINQS